MIVVKLSGADVIEVVFNVAGEEVEVRQYHRDFQSDDVKYTDQTGFYDVVYPEPEPADATGWQDETNEWFDKIRSGDDEAVEEAILLLRTHALPEDHPLAID